MDERQGFETLPLQYREWQEALSRFHQPFPDARAQMRHPFASWLGERAVTKAGDDPSETYAYRILHEGKVLPLEHSWRVTWWAVRRKGRPP